MKKPVALTPSDPVWEITRIFNTALVVRKDFSAVPLTQILVTGCFYRYFQNDYTDIMRHRTAWSTLCMLALLGSEWCHNLAHVFIANRINKPVDRVRITFGMPLLVYFDPHDPAVAAREHMLRAIGGPIFNAMTLVPLYYVQRATKPGTPQHFLAQLTLGTNLMLLVAAMTPHPSLDGGPLLKWSLIDAGRPENEAEAIIKRANGLAALLLSSLSAILYLIDKKLISVLLGLLGLNSLVIALGWLDEAY